MVGKNNEKIIFISIGIILGVLATSMAGKILFKAVRKVKTPQRYNAQKIPLINGKSYGVVIASSLDRIFKDGETLVKPDFRQEASISLAKNEYESFQIAVRSTSEELKAVNLEIAPLTHQKSGMSLNEKDVSWRIVGYVPTKQPYYPVKYVGLWPDPLLPRAETDIPAQTVQPFWVTVYMPAEAPAGEYHSLIKVRSGEKVLREIPLNVRVYDFILPKENTFKTAFDFYGHHMKDRYRQGDKESSEAYQARLGTLNDRYIIEMLRYRLNPILNIDPTVQAHLGRVDRYRWHGLNNFSIGRYGGTYNNNWPNDDAKIDNLEGLYRTYGEILKLNKMLEYTYIYTWDEGAIGNPKVAKICSMIHRAYPGLKNMVCYHGFWEPEKHPDWGKDIDIWCFNNDNFDEKKLRAMQELGKEMWMYISGPSGLGGPNYAIDFDSLDYRIPVWIAWKYDIRGLLYWCVNWWPFVDPFKSAANTKWEQNGNGLLFYPGEKGPIASLRLEIIRDSIEDYEYLTLLKKLVTWIEKKGIVDQFQEQYFKAKELIGVGSLITSMFHYRRDNQGLLEHRNNVANTAEALIRIMRQAQDEN